MRTSLAFLLLAVIFAISSAQTASNNVFLNETFFSGFLNTATQGKIFYWLFESRQNPETDPLILHIGGGPGCSSELAVFFQNGPYNVEIDMGNLPYLVSNPYSWNNIANVLYIDLPLGVGYSQTNKVETDENAIVSDFLPFLNEFLAAYPEYNGRNTYIAGSSYTGHYIPLIAETVKMNPTHYNVTLQGVLIGNGWVDPVNQYASDATFAYENDLINALKFNTLKAAFQACKTLISAGKYDQAVTTCKATMTQLIGNPPNFNYYNINQTCAATSNCYNFTTADLFLNQTISKLTLGVSGLTYRECNSTVDSLYAKDRVMSTSQSVSSLLNYGAKVLVYNGDQDLIANWLGGQYWTTNVSWTGQQGFIAAPYVVNQNYGEYKAYQNFVYYRVYDAGHLVGIEQPAANLDLLVKFINGWSQEEEISVITK